MDDTLLDFARAEEENLRRTFLRTGIDFSEKLHERYHEINDGLWRKLERGELTRERLKSLRFELLFSEFQIPADPMDAAKIYYSNFPSICFPFDGAREFLEELSKRGRIYLVTNGGTDIQRSHISLADFGRFLTDVFISEEVGADKPSEEYVRYVAAHIEDFQRERALYVGDSFSSDAPCAERLHVDFIPFRPRLPSRPQYHEILSRL